MPTYPAGTLVLLNFPHTDAAGVQRRPALVLLDVGDDDIIVARVTSQAWQGTFDVDLKGWKDAGLLLPSIVRLHKVVTLEKHLVRRTLGHLSKEDWAVVKAKLQTLWMFS